MKQCWKNKVYPNFLTTSTQVQEEDIINFRMISISSGFRLHISRYTIPCPTIRFQLKPKWPPLYSKLEVAIGVVIHFELVCVIDCLDIKDRGWVV